jgi:hypothetical protein
MASLHAIQQSIARFHAECLSVERDIIGRRDIPGRDFSALGLYRLRARKLEQEFTQELQRREQAVRDQMQRVQEAQRRVRLIEKLRERRLAEHQYLEDKEIETLAAEAFLAKWERATRLSGASPNAAAHAPTGSPVAPTGLPVAPSSLPVAPTSHDGSQP